MSDSLKLIQLQGADAEQFLQGQLTSNVAQLQDAWQFTGYCSPKGRLLASGILWRTGEVYSFLCHPSVVDTVANRLRMYVLRSKVTISLRDAAITAFKPDFSFSGNENKIAQEIDDHAFTLSCLDSSFKLTVSFEESVSDATSDDQVIDNSLVAKWLDWCVDQGILLVDQISADGFVPQMVNLDLIGGISFKKGCYTGQEIVARMHYLGKLKQRLYKLRTIEARNTISAGDDIYTASTEPSMPETDENRGPSRQNKIGTVVSISSDTQTLLAVLRIEHADETLVVHSSSTAEDKHFRIELMDLPYPATS